MTEGDVTYSSISSMRYHSKNCAFNSLDRKNSGIGARKMPKSDAAGKHLRFAEGSPIASWILRQVGVWSVEWWGGGGPTFRDGPLTHDIISPIQVSIAFPQ